MPPKIESLYFFFLEQRNYSELWVVRLLHSQNPNEKCVELQKVRQKLSNLQNLNVHQNFHVLETRRTQKEDSSINTSRVSGIL